MLVSKKYLTINEKEFIIEINVGSMIECEVISNQSFMTLVAKAEKGSVESISYLLASCLKDTDGTPVGMDYVKAMDFGTFEEIFEPLFDAIIASFPDGNSKKKAVVVKETR